jgi:hypothetical protein
MAIPKTWAQVKRHEAVASVEVLPGEEVKYWIYLKPGFSAAADPGNIHQGNGRTVAEAIADVFPVHTCDCLDCR